MQQLVRKAEILGALSRALDLTEGQPAGHCLRCCWIGVQIGQKLGLPAEQLHDLYYTLLLKDLGCSSNAARICALYLTDDLQFKHDFRLLDGNLPQVLRFVLNQTGASSELAERFRAVVNILKNGGRIATELIETRCQRGADIARQLHFSEHVCEGILDLDEHWDGSGKPLAKHGEQIALFSRIALLTQVVDVFFKASGMRAAFSEIVSRKDTWFDPAIVDAFAQISGDDSFWNTLDSDDIEAVVLGMEPGAQVAIVDEDYLDDLAFAFARVIDAKSPYTAGHSERVALFADLIAEQMGWNGKRRRTIRRAALLHDIGKLGVSNAILDKPGKLTDQEWLGMKLHAELSEAILSRIDVFADLAVIGGAHHERLDGKGYPRGISGDAIDLATRIVSTADVFDALTADRPYRKAMPVSQALSILREGAGTSHDPECIDALEIAIAKSQVMETAETAVA
jgi:HD-GYP domain-containing protein (c-di-GMP phosphodiesterase class II)